MAESETSHTDLPTTELVYSKHGQWLSLKEASALLGIHFTTLRKWADDGLIHVFRTPGGHRRFSATDLRNFLEMRTTREAPPDTESYVDAAVGLVRAEIEKMRENNPKWAESLTAEERDLTRQRGRQLFSLAIAYVLKPAQRELLLADGRRLGYEYGSEAAQGGTPLVEVGRAVQFFRSQLIKIVRADPAHGYAHNQAHNQAYGLDADDLRIQNAIDHFIDEVLYAVLSGYERQFIDAAPGNALQSRP